MSLLTTLSVAAGHNYCFMKSEVISSHLPIPEKRQPNCPSMPQWVGVKDPHIRWEFSELKGEQEHDSYWDNGCLPHVGLLPSPAEAPRQPAGWGEQA